MQFHLVLLFITVIYNITFQGTEPSTCFCSSLLQIFSIEMNTMLTIVFLKKCVFFSFNLGFHNRKINEYSEVFFPSYTSCFAPISHFLDYIHIITVHNKSGVFGRISSKVYLIFLFQL